MCEKDLTTPNVEPKEATVTAESDVDKCTELLKTAGK